MGFKAAMTIVPVVIVVLVGIGTLRAQGEVAMAQGFVDAVARGDAKTAATLSDGAVGASVRLCLAGTCDATPTARVVGVLRGSVTNSASPLVSMSWDARCVTAKSRQRKGGSVELYVRVQKRGSAWLVTGISDRREDLVDVCDDR